MKHRLVLPAVIAAAVLALAACTPASVTEPSPSPSPGAIAISSLADVEWVDNGEDVAPGLTFPMPAIFFTSSARLVKDGDGSALSAGQILSVHISQFSGVDSNLVNSTYMDGQLAALPLDDGVFDPALFDILVKAHVGARVLYAVPDQGQGSLIVALVVVGATDVLSRAEGAAVDPLEGVPAITLDADGKPSVSFAGAVKPTELVAQELITGSGPAVVLGQTVKIHYTGWIWEGEQFDSSWDRGEPATFPLAIGSLIDGWVQGLEGKTVGSQVLLVIPPALGYGAEGSPPAIPGDATLVFVVDILAAA